MILSEVGDITKPKVEAVVNPANGLGIMGRGIAGSLSSFSGNSLPAAARAAVAEHGKPFEAGEVYITKSGRGLKRRGVEWVYHAVTMRFPGGFTSVDIVNKLMREILTKAIWNEIKSIAIPGLGTGIGRLDSTIAANTMVQVAKKYDHLIIIKFLDHNPIFVDDINKYLGV
jgi:O-acetyl-ADP-ribose deacetylase (regulator of RNase III)|tara:strand:- start:2080 stop:2592 length:513 start_codon:yes stop_codon:yes gene_type:complete